MCMWLDFVEHQSLYPEGGAVSTAQPEPKEELAAGHGLSVAITRANLIAHLDSCCHAWDPCRRPSDLFWPWSKCPGSGMSHTTLGNPWGHPCPLRMWRGAKN